MKKRYQVMIDAFLAERRESKNGGWADVTEDDLALLDRIIRQLIKDKFEGDAENCPPLEVTLLDRNVYEHPHFRPLEYYHQQKLQEDADRVLETCLFNLRVATEAATRIMDVRRFALIQEKRKAEKKKEVASPKSV